MSYTELKYRRKTYFYAYKIINNFGDIQESIFDEHHNLLLTETNAEGCSVGFKSLVRTWNLTKTKH